MEETKTALPDGGDGGVPFIEELTEEEALAEEMSSAALQEEAKSSAPDDESSPPEPADPHEAALQKIMQELDQIEASGKDGYVNEKYNFAYAEYKRGLKSCSDLVVGREAREDAELKARYMIRRRKFAANAAAACIKIGYFQQGLEASKLILDEGPDDEMQRRKALFRAGVCARGMGELDEAKGYLTTLLEVPDLDAATQRDIKKELKRVAEEEKRYKQFAKKMVSKDNEGTIILPEKKKAPTQKELADMAAVEERRKEYQDRKRREDEDHHAVTPTKPEKLMSEEDCIAVLDVLAERYADEAIQEELKQAAYDHEMKFSKGFIIRSRMILAPLQQDLLVKHGFLDPSDVIDENAASADGSVLEKPDRKSSEFDGTLDDLVLIGEGFRERSAVRIYSVALYSGALVKESLASENKVDAIETLWAALNISRETTFLLVLKVELKVNELTGEIIDLVSGHVSNNALLANISSIMYGTERTSFEKGSMVRLDCTSAEVKVTINGEEVGTVKGLSQAIFDAYLGDTDVCPSLRKSVVGHCCNGGASSPETEKTKAGGETNYRAKVANEKAHFAALGKFQHNVRFLSQKNKEIAEKATLCRKLAVGLLYDDSMDVTGWVSL